jgi:precorrin-3B C17-methyltransferase
MSQSGRLFIVGLGPGSRETMTPQAQQAIAGADLVIGYGAYFVGLADLIGDKETIALPLTQEIERAEIAVEQAARGRTVCVISSGDPGVYGMASLVLETAARLSDDERPDLVVVPGVSAVNACASLLGAPLAHDFAVISLSDLLTPWEKIERRLVAAAEADFVIALYNPQSERRNWQYARAQAIFAAHRDDETPVGIVRSAFRPDQQIQLTTIAGMAEAPVDMLSTIIVGNSQTRRFADTLVTPRGYLDSPREKSPAP